MENVMKWARIVGPASIVLVLLALAVHWSQRPPRFATPAACLDAYREASRAGDVESYWSCLAEPLRFEIQQQYPDPKELARHLRSQMSDVKTWVQVLDSRSEDSTIQVDVDEVSLEGNRRIHFQLQWSGGGWLIASLTAPKGIPTSIPYGTHISKVSEQPPRTSD
jgi:hypothetical protein